MHDPLIRKIEFTQIVEIRKYEVDTKNLSELLCMQKKKLGFNCHYLAELLSVPVTKVEHWFRRDSCFSIPSADVWMALKSILQITTDVFDESILTFEKKAGVYEKSERHYFADGIAPTLTSTSAGNEKIIVVNKENEMEEILRIRKLTPKECFRLMDFDDEDFDKAEKVNSNTQLYKQAGNSICVSVAYYIIEALIKEGIL